MKEANIDGVDLEVDDEETLMIDSNVSVLCFSPPSQLSQLIYESGKESNWPPGSRVLDVSLKNSGKSRADLWAFAANVALEKAFERSNFACDYDYNARQQV